LTCRRPAVPRNVTAICPGTFDPVTVGHLDIIRRGASKFGRVVVGLIEVPQRKSPLFTPDEREAFLREALRDHDNIIVDRFNELVVEFARRWDAHVILKGLRAISDFEYEFAMAQLNRKLAPDIETVFMMASPEHSFLSSSGVREIAAFGGSVEDLVPPAVARRLAEAFPRRDQQEELGGGC
jgi:pantetheine-phosphate adenylyltransferase